MPQTPQRSESVKKPKIKLTTSSTPKAAANGAQSPKNGKESTTKASKPKSKAAKKDAEEKPAAPKEPELTAEERQMRKEVRSPDSLPFTRCTGLSTTRLTGTPRCRKRSFSCGIGCKKASSTATRCPKRTR